MSNQNCRNCGEPEFDHVSNGYCAGQPLNDNDDFPEGYTPTKFQQSEETQK